MPTLDQANVGRAAGTGVTTTNITTSNAVAAGALIEVIVFRFSSGNPTAAITVSGSGLTWTMAPTQTQSGNIKIAKGYAFAPAGLAAGSTITVGTASGTGDLTTCAVSHLGVDTTTPLDSSGGTSGSTQAWSTNALTGTDAGDLASGGAGLDGALLTSTATGDANARNQHNSAVTNGSVTLFDDLVAEADDSVAGSWSSATPPAWVSVGASFNEATAAATPPASFPLVMPLRLFGMGPPLIAGFEGDQAAAAALGLSNDTGLATAAGGTSSLSVTVINATGAATAGGGTSALAVGVTNASGTATAAGGTSTLSVTVANVSGTANAAGGTSALAVTLSNAGGTATAGGGTSSTARTISNAGGTATATGGVSALTFVYANATGGATAGGGTSTVSIVSGLTITNVGGTASASGGVSALAFTFTSAAGAATATGGASTVTITVPATGFVRRTHATTGGFERVSSTGGEFTRVDSTADPFQRQDPDHDQGFERLPDEVGSGFVRVTP